MKELERISEITAIPIYDLLGRSRKKDISEARQICVYLLRQRLTEYETAEIFGINHSTVNYHYHKIGNYISIKDKKIMVILNKYFNE